jgi:hypothetical protein
MFTGSVRVIGKDIIEAKLAKAEANILAHNYAMVSEMLVYVKAEVVPQIPLGPGHFGNHARDTFTIIVTAGKGQMGTMITGVLKAAVQAFWREYGTGMRYRGSKKKAFGVRIMTGRAGTGGEHAHLTAHHALAGIKKYINFYYGGMAKWWHT